jgi:hypothetical protein
MSILLPRPMTRRGALRGILAGAAVQVALPFLDCTLNENGTALAATGAPLPVRFGTWYWGMGHSPNAYKAKSQTSQGIEFNEETDALTPHKDNLSLMSGFNLPLDGGSNFTHWTGWVASRTGGAPQTAADIPAPTFDILIADAIGGNTRFKTLDISCIGAPTSNYSARSTNSRRAADVSPIAFYTRLFGADFVDPNKADFKPDPRIMTQKSVLSAFMEDSKDYMKTLGAADKARLDEYFTSVRQVEQQLALQLEKPAANEACQVPEKPQVLSKDQTSVRELDVVVETHEVMSKLLAMAVACNQTKVFNMVFTDHLGNVRRAGEAYTHHLLTHEEAYDEKLGHQPVVFEFGKANMRGLAAFLDTMSSFKEGSGTLLDNCLIHCSSETEYARVHTIDNIPVYLAGKAGGRVKPGFHVVGGGDPASRIGLTVLQVMGAQVDKWGTKSLQTSKPIAEIMV